MKPFVLKELHFLTLVVFLTLVAILNTILCLEPILKQKDSEDPQNLFQQVI